MRVTEVHRECTYFGYDFGDIVSRPRVSGLDNPAQYSPGNDELITRTCNVVVWSVNIDRFCAGSGR